MCSAQTCHCEMYAYELQTSRSASDSVFYKERLDKRDEVRLAEPLLFFSSDDGHSGAGVAMAWGRH